VPPGLAVPKYQLQQPRGGLWRDASNAKFDPAFPFSRAKWSMTKIGQLVRSDAKKADEMARLADHQSAKSARKEWAT